MNIVDRKRRRFLTTVTTALGGAGGVLAAVPFVKSMSPSASALALGGPAQIDISKLEQGQMISDIWQGKPVWVLRRTSQMLAQLPKNKRLLADPDSMVESQQPAYAQNLFRSIEPEVCVLIGLCTHLGCVPTRAFNVGDESGLGEDWPGGFFCPCHGSKFDFSGRVFKNVPAPTNLVVPPHRYLSRLVLEIGVDSAS